MNNTLKWSMLLMTVLYANLAHAQLPVSDTDVFDYYKNPNPQFPIALNPTKWAQQPVIDSWEGMEKAVGAAFRNKDGYSLYQLAYQEYVHQYTKSAMDPRTMLFNAFEMGLKKGDPYLMYWVTELEDVVYFRFEYLDRRRNHARLTDSIATSKMEIPVLYRLADLNDKSFNEMKRLAATYLQCAYLKDETFGLIAQDPRVKAKTMEASRLKK
jgi:hypothetical protein